MATPCIKSLGCESGGHKHGGDEGRWLCWKFATVAFGSGRPSILSFFCSCVKVRLVEVNSSETFPPSGRHKESMVAKHTVLLCLVTAAARAAAFAPSARVNTSPYIYGEGVRFRQARHGMQMMAVEPLGGCDREGRRAAIVAAGRATAATVALVGMGPVAPANAKGGDDLIQRLDSDKVQQLPADMGNRVDLEYPAWLEGTWTVTSTMESFKAPLGNRFLGGSNPEINDRSAAEAAAQVRAVNGGPRSPVAICSAHTR